MSSSYKTAVSVFAGATARRGKIYDVLIGTDGTPADNAVDWDISRMTADGTGSAATPQALDPADPAMAGTSKVNYTAEPTVTAASSLFPVGVNQRAPYAGWRRPARSWSIRRSPTTASCCAPSRAAIPRPSPAPCWWKSSDACHCEPRSGEAIQGNT